MTQLTHSDGYLKIKPTVRIIWLWGAALLLHWLSAWNNAGISHYDEHFQIFEFVNYKLGHVSMGKLPWEFTARVRPWIQPGLYLLIGRAVTALTGRWDPFTIATACRLFSTTISFGALFVFWKKFLKAEWFAAVVLCLFYFFDFLGARTSGENLGASFFVFGLALVMEDGWLAALGAGLLFGVSFEFRYQMAFAILGAGAWLAYVKRPRLRVWIGIALGFLLMLGVGAWIDRWGYGIWDFTPWRYFQANIILHRANGWGTSLPPWYFYGYVKHLWLGLGAVVLVGWVASWILAPWSVLSWVSFAFFIGHSAVSHKEVRFLFPIVIFSVFGLCLLFERYRSRRWMPWALGVVGLLNTVALIRVCFFPLSPGIPIMQAIYERSGPAPVVFYESENPVLFYQFEQSFYTPQGLIHEVDHGLVSDYETKLKALHGRTVFLYFKRPRGTVFLLGAMAQRCPLVKSVSEDGGLGLKSSAVRLLYQCQ